MNAEQKAALITQAKEHIDFLEGVLERRGHIFDLEQEQLSLFRIALASLTSEPMIWHSGDIIDLLAEGNLAAHRTGTHVMPLYAAPPVPVMKPVKLPMSFSPDISVFGTDARCVMRADKKGRWLNKTGVIAALREAGIQIEGEE